MLCLRALSYFEDEPLLRVIAPLPEAQLVETTLLNLVHFQTVVASKAARCVVAAPGKLLVDFGLRRAHGLEAGLLSARASYLAGFAGTSNILAGLQFGVPLYGTVAHSFVEAHETEAAAFLCFGRTHPNRPVLLIDTYDTERGAKAVVTLAPRLAAEGVVLGGVRIDSGDLLAHARAVRRSWTMAGCSVSESLQAAGSTNGPSQPARSWRTDRWICPGNQNQHIGGCPLPRLRLQARRIRRPTTA